MKYQARPIQFVEFEGGCQVALTHSVNQDGYFRKVWATEEGKIQEMFHRFIWRALEGDIPEGYEINHQCRNRACCNPAHLEILSREEHLLLTNKGRYKSRIEKGKGLLKDGVDKHTIAALLRVSWFTVHRWSKDL